MILKKLSELGLTELETLVLKSFIPLLYAEPGFSDVDVKDISYSTKLKINQVKGVVGSLCKKGILYAEMGDFQGLIYLSDDYWYLHPEWKEQWFKNKVAEGWFREQFGLDTSAGSFYSEARAHGMSDLEAQEKVFYNKFEEMSLNILN